jgi:hypothetical protein
MGITKGGDNVHYMPSGSGKKLHLIKRPFSKKRILKLMAN